MGEDKTIEDEDECDFVLNGHIDLTGSRRNGEGERDVILLFIGC